MNLFGPKPSLTGIITHIRDPYEEEKSYELTLEELQLIYRQLEHEYIQDNKMRELLNKIQKMIENAKLG